MSFKIDRHRYAELFGPTEGDSIRLGDTDLFIKIEKDYVQGLDGLPKSDVLKFLLEDNCSLVVRPSGTEPKLKIYISVSAENKEMAEKVEDEIAKTAEKWIC